MSMTTTMATTDSGGGGVASGIEDKVVGAALTPPPPPPTSSSFALGEKQDSMLKVVSGNVRIMSTSTLDKHVMLGVPHVDL